MIDSLAERIAVSIKKANEEQTASVEIMKFSLIIVLNTTAVLLLCVVIGYITGELANTMCSFLGFAILRIVSGGFHFRSAVSCTIGSTLLFTVIPHIPLPPSISLWLMGITLTLVLIFAPSNIEGHSRIRREHYPVLKIISLLIICTNFIWFNPILTKAFFVQSLLLIRRGEVKS